MNKLDKLPKDLYVSTITVTCKIDTDFYIENIAKFIDIDPDKIVSLRFGATKPNSNKTKRLKKFYNQITVNVKSKKINNVMSVKLFQNGSVQMTGCKSIENCADVLEILCFELKKSKFIIQDNILIPKPFVSKPENINISKIYDYEIRMINSNIKIDFKIDREKLYKLLLQDGISCSYEPCGHAGMDFKLTYEGKDISIFVFESGSIIITGAKTQEHLIFGYNFVVKKLYEHFNKIILLDNLDSIIQKLNLEA